jgi:hypothetical protein
MLSKSSKSIFGAGFALLFVTFAASAGTVPFDTVSYNFPLAGGGGGSSAMLNGVAVEVFCDDFDNDMSVPKDYTADVTTLGTSANLSDTRFGGVTSWTTIALSDGNTALDSTDDAFFNSSATGTSALVRYEMAAYLVSLYNRGQGNNVSNNEIQEAIWTILDPKAEGAAIDPAGVNPDSYIEQAVSWYNSMSGNQSALNRFLSNFEIVSPANMNYVNGLGIGGFQEQIVMTPEPRGGVWMILGLLFVGILARVAYPGTRIVEVGKLL